MAVNSHQDSRVIKILHMIGMGLMVALMGVVFAGAASVTRLMLKENDQTHVDLLAQTGDAALKESIRQHGDTLKLLVAAYLSNPALEQAFASRDRGRLLDLAAPALTGMRAAHEINHMYFILPDHTVFLRVHAPDHWGDLIDRDGLIQAQNQGGTTTGLETGIYGKITLRSVAPWFDRQGQLLGYLEIGIDFLNILGDTRAVADGQLYLFASKNLVERDSWEHSKSGYGPFSDWSSLPQMVLVNQSAPLPPSLSGHVRELMDRNEKATHLVEADDRSYGLSLMPLTAGSSQGQGQVWLLVVKDLESLHKRTGELARTILWSTFAGCILLVAAIHLVLTRIESLVILAEAGRRNAERIAQRDGLTGVLNRREFDRRLEDELAAIHAQGGSLGLMMLDLDHFKAVNDTYGHQAGDLVLKKFARIVESNIRPTDHFARFGGEEFAVILPGAGAEAMASLAGRILSAVRRARMELDDGGVIAVTVSIGMAQCSDRLDSAGELIAAADRALYHAKQSGRDRAVQGQDWSSTLRKVAE